MNTLYTEAFSEAFAESHPYEFKQKFKQKRNKPESDKKVKPSHCRVGREVKRSWEDL